MVMKLYTLFLVIQKAHILIEGQTLTFCKDQLIGQQCEIICTTPDHSKDVSFLKTSNPSLTIGACSLGFCSVASSSYSVSQPNTTTTVLSFVHSKNEAEEWQCNYGASSTKGILKWGTYPISITAIGFPSNSTLDTAQEADVKLECFYSESPPEVYLYIAVGNNTIVSQDNSPCSLTNETCADPDFKTYACNVTVIADEQVDCTQTYSLGVNVKVSHIETPKPSSALGTDIKYDCFETTTEEERVTPEQSTIASSIISTQKYHSSTNESNKDSTDNVSLNSADQVSSTTTSAVTEPKSVLAPLVISVSVVCSCLVVIFVVILCVLCYKRHKKNKKPSDNYQDLNPSSKNDHVYFGKISNNQKASFHDSRTTFISKTEYCPEISHKTYSHSGRNMPEQRSIYDNTIYSVDNMRDYKGQGIQMGYQPHLHFKRAHGNLIRQPIQLNNCVGYSVYDGRNRRGIINHRGHYNFYPYNNLY